MHTLHGRSVGPVGRTVGQSAGLSVVQFVGCRDGVDHKDKVGQSASVNGLSSSQNADWLGRWSEGWTADQPVSGHFRVSLVAQADERLQVQS